MKCIHMGLNTEPDWLKEKEVVERFKKAGDAVGEKHWVETYSMSSKKLREQIIEAVESDGEVELSWSCMGETRHTMHSQQWAKAIPQYNFDIGRYKCIVRK